MSDVTQGNVEQKPIEGTTTETTSSATEDSTILTEGAPAGAPAAPEKYENFTLPEGVTLADEQLTAATGVFKELGLSQASAQKLVDFHTAQLQAMQNAPVKLWQDQQKAWRDEIAADPKIGPKLNEVRTTISKAIDTIGDPTLIAGFKQAMNLTGAGNNPAFIRAFYALAQKLTEGTHVAGNGPSALGQISPGSKAAAKGPSALYPNLA